MRKRVVIQIGQGSPEPGFWTNMLLFRGGL